MELNCELDPYTTVRPSAADLQLMDTNRDGVVNSQGRQFRYTDYLKKVLIGYYITDDPYAPYYPGDEYVDWVGASIYTYGTTFPWSDNISAPPGKFDEILNGNFHHYFLFIFLWVCVLTSL